MRMAESERVLHAEPELERRGVVDRLADVEAQRGPLDEAEDGDVHAQAHAERVGDAADDAAVRVDRAHVVERRQPDVPRADE